MSKLDELHFEEIALGGKTGREDYIELPLHREVFVGVAAASMLIGGIILGRIAFLGITKADFYVHRAIANVDKETSIPAARGAIVDRNGTSLVKNRTSFSVFLNVRAWLKKTVDERERATKTIATLVTPQLTDETMRLLFGADALESQNNITLGRDVDEKSARALQGLEDPAIIVREDYRREYVDGRTLSHVIGYTGVDDADRSIVGRSGLEAYYNRELTGKEGTMVEARDARGNTLGTRIKEDAFPGGTLVTTIDKELQTIVYDRMRAGLLALDREAGVAIVLKPSTGEVLAMVNFPSFDNNAFTSPGKSDERTRLLTSPRKPLFNRAIAGAYSPGSTIKPMMALAALHEGVVKPTDQFFSSGVLELPNPYDPERPSRFLDWRAHGWVDVHSALARSSNVYFYIVGGGWKDLPGLGIARIKAYWDRFRFGEETGIDLPGEKSGMLLSQEEWEKRFKRNWRVGNTYNTSIGQGDMLATPLRLVAFIGAIGNNGIMQEPHIVSEIVSAKGEHNNVHFPKNVVDFSDLESELREVKQGMRDAVEKTYGTAHALNDLPITVSGKTGSAQIANNAKTNAFFLGYAPSDDPEIAILVLIEDAKEGSLNTIPIAKDIFAWYAEHRLQK